MDFVVEMPLSNRSGFCKRAFFKTRTVYFHLASCHKGQILVYHCTKCEAQVTDASYIE